MEELGAFGRMPNKDWHNYSQPLGSASQKSPMTVKPSEDMEEEAGMAAATAETAATAAPSPAAAARKAADHEVAFPFSPVPSKAAAAAAAAAPKAAPASSAGFPAAGYTQEELDDIAGEDARWSWIEVDLAAIRHNIGVARNCLGPGRRLCAVVKADGYGHGSVQVAKASLSAGADYLAVATVPEGVKLRKAGITAPCMVLAEPPETAIPLLLGYNLVPALFNAEFAIAYGEAADLRGMKAPFHLAINTGMNRIGVRYDKAVEFVRTISFHRALEQVGTFTHFATADSPVTLDFNIQLRRFTETVNALRAAGFNPGIVHCANSAAIMRYPQTYMDMGRWGISLYGYHPCEETEPLAELRPAMSVYARIHAVNSVPINEGVSYGLHYRSPGSVKICAIPVGYADGFPRDLSSNTTFIYNGVPCRQVGNICMDQCMFEVDMRSYNNQTRLDPQVGDKVLIAGGTQLPIDQLAYKIGTIPHEIICAMALRMPRVYR